MIKEGISNLKNILKLPQKGTENKKYIENLIVLGIILIITVIFINYIWNDNSNKETPTVQTQNVAKLDNSNTDIETKLKNILSKINGVGTVEVMVTYSQSSKTIPLYNEDTKAITTEEKDTSGGVRKVVENNSNREVVYNDKSIVTQSIISPTIEGAVIIATGATNASVKNNIIQAVEAVTGLSTHKIQVFEMK